MAERRKYLGQVTKDYYKTFTSSVVRVDEPGLSGYAAHLKVIEVNRPFMVGEKGAEVCLADSGYSELNYLPDGANWQLSAMYDDQGRIIEWYIDMTRKNAVDEEGKPYCDDLYLDAALMPDGQILIFDEKELEAALNAGKISRAEFDMAYRVLKELTEEKILSLDYMKTLCARLLRLF